MTIYANLSSGRYYGVDVEVRIRSRFKNWFECLLPDGRVKTIHREYMSTSLSSLGELNE